MQQRPGTARRLVGNFEDEIGTALVGIAATRAVGLVFSGDLFGTDSTDPSPPAPPAGAAYLNGPDYTPGYSGVSQFGSNWSADLSAAARSAGAATYATYPNGPDYTTAAGSSPSYDNDDTEIWLCTRKCRDLKGFI